MKAFLKNLSLSFFFLGGCSQMPLDQASITLGEKVFTEREKGHCLLCHSLSGHAGAFHGNLGPSLDGVATRLTEAQLYQRIADSRQLHPNTIMPPYLSTESLQQVAAEYQGETVLTEAEVRALVAYLMSVTGEQ